MYGALWRVLPGPVWLRILIILAGVAVILAACMLWVFPWAQSFIEPPDVTVGE